MRAIIAKDLTEYQYSNEDGDVLFNEIHNRLKEGKKAVVSFKGIYALNSSYINSAFVQLLDYYSYSFIKEHLMLNRVLNLLRGGYKHEIEKRFSN